MKDSFIICRTYFRFFLFTFILIKITYELNPTFEEVQKALQEVAFGYYMRGKNIQYNSHKVHWFSPEEATSQNINYLVCSGFTRNVYRELLNITIPISTAALLNYSKYNIGRPEVIAYSFINKQKLHEMQIYSPKEKNKIKTIIQPSLKDIIPLIQIGDILTYTGHTFLIYDVERDSNGNVIDGIIMESGHGIGKAYVNSKIAAKVKLSNGNDFAGPNHYLYLNSKINSNFKEGRQQGSVGLNRLSKYKQWYYMNNVKERKEEYSILRFIQKDSQGNAVLKYKATNLNSPNQILDNQIIVLPQKNLDKANKFNHIYIEKRVNAFNNNIVELGDVLNYTLIIQNNGEKAYRKDIIVTENLSPLVTFIDHHESNAVQSFEKDLYIRKLKWNIGKLEKGQKFIINYTVKVTNGNSRDIIESTGLVGNIPSSVIRNVIGVNLNKSQMDLIKTKFDKLKKKFNGKRLINEIYREALNYDIRFEQFDITNLIMNIRLDSTQVKTIYLNKQNPFYKAVLNKYWSTLTSVKHTYIKNGKEVEIYDLKRFRDYYDLERREDFIYPETLKTGDILIYKNHNDATYSVKNNELIEKKITFENGEYVYIYIEGKGFVGVNLGDDKKTDTKDDRNEFNYNYYIKNGLELYPNSSIPSNKELEIANLQSLFGKDYYVILRPSLCFDFQ